MRLDRDVLYGGDFRPIDVIGAQPVRFTFPKGGTHTSNQIFGQIGLDGTGWSGDHRRNQVGVLGLDVNEVGSAVDRRAPQRPRCLKALI